MNVPAQIAHRDFSADIYSNAQATITLATIECIDNGRDWSEYDARTGSSDSTFVATGAAA